ncbi:MAG: hypothetical protein E6I96_10035 [Chloroflexi bacterium]|nr:MAG: hypothetical protein E6I96_10035 [Chloroflexota bacterium]
MRDLTHEEVRRLEDHIARREGDCLSFEELVILLAARDEKERLQAKVNVLEAAAGADSGAGA